MIMTVCKYPQPVSTKHVRASNFVTNRIGEQPRFGQLQAYTNSTVLPEPSLLAYSMICDESMEEGNLIPHLTQETI